MARSVLTKILETYSTNFSITVSQLSLGHLAILILTPELLVLLTPTWHHSFRESAPKRFSSSSWDSFLDFSCLCSYKTQPRDPALSLFPLFQFSFMFRFSPITPFKHVPKFSSLALNFFRASTSQLYHLLNMTVSMAILLTLPYHCMPCLPFPSLQVSVFHSLRLEAHVFLQLLTQSLSPIRYFFICLKCLPCFPCPLLALRPRICHVMSRLSLPNNAFSFLWSEEVFHHLKASLSIWKIPNIQAWQENLEILINRRSPTTSPYPILQRQPRLLALGGGWGGWEAGLLY